MSNNKKNEEPTISDVLDTISDFAGSVENRFEKMDQRFEKVEGELTTIKATMVTKDYLDTKMADLRGDLVVMMRKEDVKLKTLVEILENKKVIDKKEAKRILCLEPFPQLAL